MGGVESSDHPTPEEAEDAILELVEKADLRRPDEVRYEAAEDELVCCWHEEKLVVVIELSDRPVVSPPV